eukprot:2665870-Prymnesium_polylepis.1
MVRGWCAFLDQLWHTHLGAGRGVRARVRCGWDVRATPSPSRLRADGPEPVGCVACALCAVLKLQLYELRVS